ncbi:MAG: D-hexose-6-phosphate mutarotase [Proteobacteria bacterium]|nr:D-hexose-6-phosphate mutarotase [Pseudomonadota bacterium]MBU1058950.1 D-hexose-6-phosphate mutarotase [Pseudomonadota bacterium]
MIEHKIFDHNFEYIEIRNKSAQAKVALQGAHLFSYKGVDNKPLLWLSETSFFRAGKAIRGGIPICWPWFGKHKTEPRLPQHGFARTFLWELLAVNEPNAYSTEIILQLQNSDESLRLWPHRFSLQLRLTVAQELTLALTTKNCDEKAFEISSALHSYFTVTDIANVSVEGLHNSPYLDTVTQENKTQRGNLSISREVDRIFQDVHNPLILHDQERTIHIAARGSSSVVIWNPWIEKCARMSDMKDDAYKKMLCIETANVLTDRQRLPPAAEHTLTAIISEGSEKVV